MTAVLEQHPQVTEHDQDGPDYTVIVAGDVMTMTNLVGSFAMGMDTAHSQGAGTHASMIDLATELDSLLARQQRGDVSVMAEQVRQVAVDIAVRAMYTCDQYGELRG